MVIILESSATVAAYIDNLVVMTNGFGSMIVVMLSCMVVLFLINVALYILKRAMI